MPMPMFGEELTVTQPDGTQIKVRGWGNQHHAFFRTLEGYPVIQNRATGYLDFAAIGTDFSLRSVGLRAGIDPRPSSPLATTEFSAPQMKALAVSNPGLPIDASRWRVRCERKKIKAPAIAIDGLTLAPPDRKTIGNFVGLCVLMDFPDVQGTIGLDEVDRFLNSAGYTGFGNSGSVREYFRDTSNGKLNYTNIVVGYVRAKKPRSYYTDRRVAQPIRTYELIAEAISSLKGQGFDFSRLTVDDESYAYAMNFYYAGRRENNWSEGLWPHCWHLKDPVQVQPGIKLYDYQITDIGDELTLGTFCHENGHMICDFPDLYDYGGNSAGAGEYCLMCAGGNANPKNPTHVGAYLKYRAGWANSVTPLASGSRVNLGFGQNDFCVFEKDGREYFILENRQKLGRDEALPSAGLAIWHIDETGSNNNEQSTAASHYECALKQADGRYDLEHDRNLGDAEDLYPNGGRRSFTDATTPSSRWWNGSPSGLSVQEIVDTGNQVSFTVR